MSTEVALRPDKIIEQENQVVDLATINEAIQRFFAMLFFGITTWIWRLFHPGMLVSNSSQDPAQGADTVVQQQGVVDVALPITVNFDAWLSAAIMTVIFMTLFCCVCRMIKGCSGEQVDPCQKFLKSALKKDEQVKSEAPAEAFELEPLPSNVESEAPSDTLALEHDAPTDALALEHVVTDPEPNVILPVEADSEVTDRPLAIEHIEFRDGQRFINDVRNGIAMRVLVDENNNITGLRFPPAPTVNHSRRNRRHNWN